MKVSVNSHPGVENALTGYIHCSRCITEHFKTKIGVGFTDSGDIQVWCENHNINVALIEITEND